MRAGRNPVSFAGVSAERLEALLERLAAATSGPSTEAYAAVYEEIRRVARWQRRQRNAGETLSTTRPRPRGVLEARRSGAARPPESPPPDRAGGARHAPDPGRCGARSAEREARRGRAGLRAGGRGDRGAGARRGAVARDRALAKLAERDERLARLVEWRYVRRNDRWRAARAFDRDGARSGATGRGARLPRSQARRAGRGIGVAPRTTAAKPAGSGSLRCSTRRSISLTRGSARRGSRTRRRDRRRRAGLASPRCHPGGVPVDGPRGRGRLWLFVPAEAGESAAGGRRGRRLAASRRVGRGGLGEVYLARRHRRDFGDGRGEAARAPSAASELRASIRPRAPDSRALARTVSPASSTAASPPTEHYVLALEYVEGGPASRVVPGRRSSVEQRLRIFVDFCERSARALQSRRPSRPEAVEFLVDRDGQVELLDFGIARSSNRKTTPAASRRGRGSHGVSRDDAPLSAPERLNGGLVRRRPTSTRLGLLCSSLLRPDVRRWHPSARIRFRRPHARRARRATVHHLAEAVPRRLEGTSSSGAVAGDLDRVVDHAVAGGPRHVPLAARSPRTCGGFAARPSRGGARRRPAPSACGLLRTTASRRGDRRHPDLAAAGVVATIHRRAPRGTRPRSGGCRGGALRGLPSTSCSNPRAVGSSGIEGQDLHRRRVARPRLPGDRALARRAARAAGCDL